MYEQARPAGYCTTGFIVVLEGTSTRRVLTAGHCLELALGGLGAAWMHSGTKIGNGKTETWGNLSNADAGLVAVDDPISGPDNLVYASNHTDIRSVNGWVSTLSQNVGDFICRNGKTSGWWCGHIKYEDRTRDVDGKDIDHQWVVDFDASPGDSGAPYITDAGTGASFAWGIHSDSTSADPPGGEAWYSPIGWVLQKLNSYGTPIELCLNGTCDPS
jgi:V8-like Glu-specific endopeptidase